MGATDVASGMLAGVAVEVIFQLGMKGKEDFIKAGEELFR